MSGYDRGARSIFKGSKNAVWHFLGPLGNNQVLLRKMVFLGSRKQSKQEKYYLQ